jgi:hypothetical protein
MDFLDDPMAKGCSVIHGSGFFSEHPPLLGDGNDVLTSQ